MRSKNECRFAGSWIWALGSGFSPAAGQKTASLIEKRNFFGFIINCGMPIEFVIRFVIVLVLVVVLEAV
jgi:hypothetical protein